MWELDNPTIESTVLDFSSSGQVAMSVSRLVQDGQVIFNAIELIDWQPHAFQATVCEACGTPGCASGGWIALRSSGGLVLFVPAFDAIAESRQRQDEYAPPSYLLERGAAYLTNAGYDQLRTRLSKLPHRGDLRQFRSGEAVAMYQLEAPYRMFGVPPDEFAVRDDSLVGASRGDVRSVVKEIKVLAETLASKDQPVTIRELRPDEEVVSLYIDSFDFVDWGAMAASASASYLMVGSKFVLENEAPSSSPHAL